MMQYTQVTGDGTYYQTIGGALGNASFGKSASFLGDPSLEVFSSAIGKWNDDIAWWALASVVGAEIGGINAKTSSGSFFTNISANTLKQITEPPQLDNECGGGIYWARNRQDQIQDKAIYKSTITNVEAITLAMNLHFLTGEKSYLDLSIAIYDWLVGPSNLVFEDGRVYDGIRAGACDQMTRIQHSYNPGLFLGGSALLFKATGDAKYITRAKVVLQNFEAVFVKNGIITEQCELYEGICALNKAQFKGVAIHGLSYLYEYSNDADIRSKIASWIEASSAAMLKTCDNQWSCSNFWLPNATNPPRDVHNQINALFVANTLSLIKKVKIDGVPLPTPEGSQGKPSNSAQSNGAQSRYGLIDTLGLSLLVF